jgi:hydrogenase maturation protease
MAEGIVAEKCLVIGCGNTLRGDDGLGPYLAETLRGAAWPHDVDIEITILPQLDIILASKVSEVDLLLFVDARADESEDLVKIEQVEPLASPVNLNHTSHTMSLSMLLRIALDWYGAAPLCYSVMPKGFDFSIGESISEGGRLSALHARNRIIEIFRSKMRVDPGRH